MAEAQLGTRVWQHDATVGILDNLAQQIALGVGLCASIDGTTAKSHIPPGVLLHPVAVDLFIREDVVECQLVAHIRALDVAGYLEQVVVQFSRIYVFLDVLHVVEE